MSSDIAIRAYGLGKCYQVYHAPHDRLKQFVLPPLQRLCGYKEKQYYREFWSLQEVDFEIKKGEIVGIVGRNGAGKSTLLQIISGILHPTTGTLEVNGRIAALLELGAGFNPDFTGRENIYMNGALLGLSKEEITRRFQDIVDFADIGEFIDRPVKTYSSGMYVRLAFAIQSQVEPEILIVDEALAVGDAKFQAKCFRRFEELVANGTTILFVTHSTEQVVRHCKWAILLHEGRLLMKGKSKEVVNTYLDMLFGVEEKEERPLQEGRQGAARQVTQLLRTGEDCFEKRAGYNPHEYRWGDKTAEIVDFCLTEAEGEHTARVETGHPLVLTLWARFYYAAEGLIYGLTIKTPDGVTVYGANSRDLADGERLPGAQPGTMQKINFILQNQCLGAGEYLLSVGVAKEAGGEIIPMDRRYDSICITVANSSARSFGLADFSMNIEVTAET